MSRGQALKILNTVEPNGELLDTETALDAMEAYGRERKIAGAKSFARLVKKMRAKQTAYFAEKRESSLKAMYLKESKKLETQVDRAVEAVLR